MSRMDAKVGVAPMMFTSSLRSLPWRTSANVFCSPAMVVGQFHSFAKRLQIFHSERRAFAGFVPFLRSW